MQRLPNIFKTKTALWGKLNGEISIESVDISVNNNTNLKKIEILSIYTIWKRLSLKTIPRYCPFKGLSEDGGGRIFLKNLCDTTFNKDLSNEPNFGQIHLAGQYL